MSASISVSGAFCLFVIAIAAIGAGFYWGYLMKQKHPSRPGFNRGDLLFMALDLALIAVAVFFFFHEVVFFGVIFGLATAFVSGILWGRSELDHTGARWF